MVDLRDFAVGIYLGFVLYSLASCLSPAYPQIAVFYLAGSTIVFFLFMCVCVYVLVLCIRDLVGIFDCVRVGRVHQVYRRSPFMFFF